MSAHKQGAPSAEDLAAQAVTLVEKPLPTTVDGTPLPPAELVDALDNSGGSTVAAAADEEVVTLEFVGDDLPEATFTLRFPFRWQGERVNSITVRQLTTAQVGKIMTATPANKAPELMDLYAAMTGLPAKVLRAIPATDMSPIIDKAYDFLPPYFRPASG